MKHGSLFSGIGGFDLAAERMGWTNVFHCEISEFPRKILHHYWPNAISYENICTTDFSIHRGNIDIISGGFPCQPFSTAGARRGTEDSRYLWPEMLRVIREVRPRWVVGENVHGLVSWDGGLVLDTVCADLENEGYEILPIVLPAASVNAPHKRNRIFFIAKNTMCDGRLQFQSQEEGTEVREQRNISARSDNRIHQQENAGITSNSNNHGLQGGIHQGLDGEQGRDRQEFSTEEHRSSDGRELYRWEGWPTQSPLCRRDDEFSALLDGISFSKWRIESIKGYGNAVVPELIMMLFKTIEEYETNTRTS